MIAGCVNLDSMFRDKLFRNAILASLIAHSLLLFQNPHLNFLVAPKKDNNIEVTYIKPNLMEKTGVRLSEASKEPFLRMDQKIVTAKNVPPPFIDREAIFKGAKMLPPEQPDINKPTLMSQEAILFKKKITMPALDLDKINNPSYISYYQIVREKIKRAAYRNYSHQDTGEVYLSFIVSNDGFLKDARLVEQKSSVNPYLRQIALRSLKDASPFPNFPKNLDYPSLSFNVVISFEIE